MRVEQEVNGNFEHFCAVSSDEVGLDIIKTHTPLELSGSQLVKYGATMGGNLPAVDMMFTWKGLEQYSLDEIHRVFKDVVRCGIKYTLIGNWPGQVNAKMVETDVGTFSIVRPDVAALNVRAYPFGFGGAERVIPMKERQLLFYNATEMRDAW